MAIDLDAEIEAARQNVAELDRLRELASARLTELDRLRSSRMAAGASSNAWPSAAKLRLFRDLFRGRDDVFAVRWENHGRSRSGYSPRCANEWQRGVCGKPKVRCGECTNQAFVGLHDRQLLAHLQGRQVIGIYPMTVAGCLPSISTANSGALTFKRWLGRVARLVSTRQSSAPGLATAPISGSSSLTLSQLRKHDGSGSRS